MTIEKHLTPQELYHATWSLALRSFWFQERLADWQKWEHRFDDELLTDDDAFRCATQMIASLQEDYTKLLLPAPDEEKDESETPCCSAEMRPGNIGYIKISSFSGNQVASQIQAAMNSIQDAVAFCVDLRGNSGGLIGQANKALSLFMDEGETYIYKKRCADEGYLEAFCRIDPTQFSERTDYQRRVHGSEEFENWRRYDNLTGNKPMVVLVNRRTGSAAELFAGVLRDNGRAVLFGTATAGKGIGQNTIPVGNGYRLQITDAVFLPPSGQWFGDVGQTVRNGIIPDVVVELDDEDDSQLAAALNRLEWMLEPVHQMQYRRTPSSQTARELEFA